MKAIRKMKVDFPRKTLLEQLWDFKKERWCRAKFYLPSQKLIAVYTINRDHLKNPDRIDVQGGTYTIDDRYLWEEDNGIMKAKFVKDGPISMVITPDNQILPPEMAEEGEEMELAGRQLIMQVKPLTIGHITAPVLLQRLQTEWGQEMFTESGILSHMKSLLGITALAAIGAVGLSLITFLKLLSM